MECAQLTFEDWIRGSVQNSEQVTKYKRQLNKGRDYDSQSEHVCLNRKSL